MNVLIIKIISIIIIFLLLCSQNVLGPIFLQVVMKDGFVLENPFSCM